MAQTDTLAELRILIDEPTEGKWTDTVLYRCINGGQKKFIQLRVAYQQKVRESDPFFEDLYLKDLLTIGSINTTSGTSSYNTPADFAEFAHASFSPDGGGTFYSIQYVGYAEFKRRAENTFLQGDSTTKTGHLAVRGSNIDVAPTPSATVTGGLLFTYYKLPSSVTSGQDFTLRGLAHDAILEYAAYMAFEKDNDPRAFQHLNNFINHMSML